MGPRALAWRRAHHAPRRLDEPRTPAATSEQEAAPDAARALDTRASIHATFAGALAAVVAALSLLGWALQKPRFTSLVEGASMFKANTALAVLAAAISLILQARALGGDSRLLRRISHVLAWVPLLIGVATFAEYMFGVDLRIDQILVADRWNAPLPGRPSPFSAAALTLIAVVLLLGPRTQHAAAYQASAALVGALSWAALVVLAYDITVIAVMPGIRTLSLPAAISYLSLTYGALWLRPRSGLMQMLLSDTLAGITARRLIPLAALVPVVFGWAYLLGLREGWFGAKVGLSLFTMGSIGGYLLVGGLGALRLYRLESIRDQATAAMQRLTERLQLATRAAHIGIWDWDLTTNTILWDRGMYELYGVPEGGFAGTYADWKRYLFREDLAHLEEAVRTALPGSRDLLVEFRIRRPDGAVRTMQGRSIVIRDASGKPMRILGADIDITALRDAEAHRLASEQRFRAIFDSATQFVGLLRPDGTVVEINRTSLEFVGRSASEVIGKLFWETPWWRALPEGQAELARAVARAARGELVRYRTTIRGREDQLATVDVSFKPLLDGRGAVAQLLAEGRDVTEAEKARIALEESEERFRAAMEYAAIGMALVSLDGRFLKVNRALCEIVGYSEAELLERTFPELTHPDDLEADLAQAEELLAGRISHYDMEKRYFHKSGRVVWILLSGSIVRSATGEPRVFLAEIQDITARKAHEEQLRASVAEKEVLLKEIHHRVKNNLQVISSILRLQSAQADSPEVSGMVEDAQARIQAMALIHDGLYRSQNLASIDFGAHLRELSAVLFRIFGRPEQAVRLAAHLEPVLLNLDTAIPLGLVANELITNALKHAFQGRTKGTIWLDLARAGRELTLTVADDGIGFPADFDFDSGKTLGLRLVTSLARQLRGHLALQRTGRNAISLTVPVDPSM